MYVREPRASGSNGIPRSFQGSVAQMVVPGQDEVKAKMRILYPSSPAPSLEETITLPPPPNQ